MLFYGANIIQLYYIYNIIALMVHRYNYKKMSGAVEIDFTAPGGYLG